MKTIFKTFLVLIALASVPAFAEGEASSSEMAGKCTTFNQDTLADSATTTDQSKKQETNTATKTE